MKLNSFYEENWNIHDPIMMLYEMFIFYSLNITKKMWLIAIR